jgi:putative DNA primase/helicase
VEYVEDGERQKAVYPVLWCRVEQNGREYCAWRSTGLPVPRPLYNLPVLLASPDALVVLVEGEKKADRVAELFPGCVGTTSMGGAKSAKCSDWTPLAGHRVIIWPDNDEPGRGYAKDVARLVAAVGAASVEIVTIPTDWPVGWDISDLLPEGPSVESLAVLLQSAAPPAPEPQPPSDENEGTEIARLASLSALQCDRELPAAAEKLGCRVPTLRAAVEAARRKGAGAGNTAGHGRRIEIPDFEPWPEPVDGPAVLDELARMIRDYIILSPHQADAVALWAVFTHTFDVFDFSPKLVIRSPEKRSGKTRLAEVLERVVRRPFFASGITAAALLRLIEQHSPAMLLDEVDTLMKGDAEMAETLRGMINSGFTRAGARFVKNVPTPDGGFEPHAFSTWCPMLLAGIGSPPDTIADRAITIEMTRKRPDQKVRRLRARDGDELRDLGRKVARWAADSRDILESADPEAPEQLNDRAADAWSPLIAIADVISGEWPTRAR